MEYTREQIAKYIVKRMIISFFLGIAFGAVSTLLAVMNL